MPTDRLWRWLHGLAEQRIRAAFMARHHHDRRCPGCGRWGAFYGWTQARDIDALHTALTCRACGHESTWCEDMLPQPVDPITRRPLPRHPMAALEPGSEHA